MTVPGLIDRGGKGDPIVLLHGLMGRGATWARQWPWLAGFGRVYTWDAPWHRGLDVTDPYPIRTERFVAALADALREVVAVAGGARARLIGHSMGGLHAWSAAAAHPDLVAAVVIEDMAPDFRGQTTTAWEPWLRALPEQFASADAVIAEFGVPAGRYFLEAFDRVGDRWRLHGRPERWIEIAAEWGTRDFWSQWGAVAVPALLIEAEHSVTPPGQMRRMRDLGRRTDYRFVAGAGHLVHDDAPAEYRAAVTELLVGAALS